MQFLANENFPLDAVEALRKEGHDVAWIRTDAPGSKDPDILKRAVAENRILLTFDKDFGDLAFQFGLPASCGIVLFRLQASSSAALAIMVVAALTSRTDWAGHFSVVEPGRIRVRALPSAAGP
jgi:predicted nuclease of predicted toxin-antitoxin system